MPIVWFEVLFVFVVLTHDRRRVLHFNVTAHPTAAWTAQQILEAFPFEAAPKYLLRDRDAIYGHGLQQQIGALGTEVLGACRSPSGHPAGAAGRKELSPSHKSADFTIDTNDWPLEWRMNLTQHVVSTLAFSHYLFSFKIPCLLDSS